MEYLSYGSPYRACRIYLTVRFGCVMVLSARYFAKRG